MVEDVVVQTIARKNIAPVICFVECPVITQPLRTQNQHAVIAQLVIFDDGECFKCLAEANAVRNYAAANAFELVDRPDHTIALEAKQLFPYDCISDAGRGLDDSFLIEFITKVFEKLEKHLK